MCFDVTRPKFLQFSRGTKGVGLLQNVGREMALRSCKCMNIMEEFMLIYGKIYGRLWWLRGKESTCNARDVGSLPGPGRSPEVKNGNQLQYSCMENPMEHGGLQSMGSQMSWTQLSKDQEKPRISGNVTLGL